MCRIPADFGELLAEVVRQLEEVMRAPEPGVVTDRLFPRAYLDPTEEAAEQEWQSLVHDDLVRERTDALVAMIADIEDATKVKRGEIEIVLDEERANRWCTVLNDARLALGTVLERPARTSLSNSRPTTRGRSAQVSTPRSPRSRPTSSTSCSRDMPEAGTADEPDY